MKAKEAFDMALPTFKNAEKEKLIQRNKKINDQIDEVLELIKDTCNKGKLFINYRDILFEETIKHLESLDYKISRLTYYHRISWDFRE